PVHSETEALERATAAVDDALYQDVHCWMFTPSSFRRLVASLQRLHLVPFTLEHCSETIGGEFFATLRAADASVVVATTSAADSLPATASEHAVLRSQLRDADLQLSRTLASRSWSVTRPLRALNLLRARLRS
ncbi:MAG: hypothetical protein ABIZ69_01530, partial [Ilumatobacteraceae bacterium]